MKYICKYCYNNKNNNNNNNNNNTNNNTITDNKNDNNNNITINSKLILKSNKNNNDSKLLLKSNKNDIVKFNKSNSFDNIYDTLSFNKKNTVSNIDKRDKCDEIMIYSISVNINRFFKKNVNSIFAPNCFDERINDIFDPVYFSNFLWHDSKNQFYKTIDSLSISDYIRYIANTIGMCPKEILTSYVILHSIVHSNKKYIFKTYTFRILWLAISNVSIKLLSDDDEFSFKWINSKLKQKIFGLNVNILLNIEYTILDILEYKFPNGEIYNIILNELFSHTHYKFDIFN